MRHAIVMIFSVLIAAGTAHAQDTQKPQYGFNWLAPKTATCTAITPKLRKSFGKCEASPGFGGHRPVQACKIGQRQQWIIYASKKACQDELETMQANG